MPYLPFALLGAWLLGAEAAAQSLVFTPVAAESASFGESMRTLAAGSLEQMKDTPRTEENLGDFALPVGSALAAKPPSSESSVEMTIDLADRSDADWVRPTGVVASKLDTHHALAFVSDPMSSAVELSGQVSGTLDFIINKADVDFTITLYELKADGEYVRLSVPYYQRASLLRDPGRRELLVPGERQQLSFVKPGPVSRRFRVGSRLVLLLGINKNRQAQVNYGTGKDVSDESIADAGAPLRIQWFSTSFVDLPVT